MAPWMLLLALASIGLPATPSGPAATTGFQRLTQLAGEWKGTYEWSGARSDRGPVRASYHLTGNGSALVEELVMNGAPTMTSVYHLDRDELRVTHYCAAGNQPRLRASSTNLEIWQIQFSFVDITNLKTPDSPHVDGLTIRSPGSNVLEVLFQFNTGSGRSVERLSLTKVRGKSS